MVVSDHFDMKFISMRGGLVVPTEGEGDILRCVACQHTMSFTIQTETERRRFLNYV